MAWRFVRNTVAGGVGWSAFFFAWHRVLANGDALGPSAVVLVALCLAGVAALIAAWVRHNRRIHARKGPRRAPALTVHEAPTVDSLGRPLHIDVGDEDREVVVSLTRDGHKRIDRAA